MNPRRRDRRPRAFLPGIAALAFCLAVFFGCAGGSGSSGFDVIENAAIDQAIDEQRCVESGGLVICPADTEPGGEPPPTVTPRFTATATVNPTAVDPTAAPTNTPERPEESRTPSTDETRTPTSTRPPATPATTPTATPTRQSTPTATSESAPTTTPEGMHIDIGLDRSSFVDCLDVGGECGFSFEFKVQGFPPDTSFLVASRRLAPDSPWQISIPNPIDPATGVLSFDALITIPVEDAEQSITVQVAVLAQSAPVGAAPASVDALGESNAEFAYVTPELQVRPIP